MDKTLYQSYIDILREELVPAMGCTEPVSVAYAAALARQTLGGMPEEVVLTVSGNIIKNVKSVIVPHTGGRKGLRTACAAGICFGNAEKKLEALSQVREEDLPGLDAFLERNTIRLQTSKEDCPFDIGVYVRAGNEDAYVRILDYHTNVVKVMRNGEVLKEQPVKAENRDMPENRKLLTVEEIVRFADRVWKIPFAL